MEKILYDLTHRNKYHVQNSITSLEYFSKLVISTCYPDSGLSKTSKIEIPIDPDNFDSDYNKLILWILQKFPFYPSSPYPSDVAYVKNYTLYESPDSVNLNIQLGMGSDYACSIFDEFESHINNFVVLRNIKKDIGDECKNYTYTFESSEDNVMNAVIVCYADKKYLFVDDTQSDFAKQHLEDFCISSKNSDYEMIYYEVPRFIINLIKKNIPELAKN